MNIDKSNAYCGLPVSYGWQATSARVTWSMLCSSVNKKKPLRALIMRIRHNLALCLGPPRYHLSLCDDRLVFL